LHWITQAAVPHLKAGASIITTASVQAYEPSASLLDYATTKAGIVAYTKALAKQMIQKGSVPMSWPRARSGPRCSRVAASHPRP
jgi:NAD(P)-dependent dehydrogenase (short-subunit alcohol dehydrogenase family)